MIRAVVSDLYGTLVRGGGDEREVVYADIAKALGVDPAEFSALFKQTANERMRGELGTIEETFTALARRLGGAPDESAIRLATLSWQRFHRRILWPSDSTLTTLDALRGRGLKLALITNCSQETFEQWPQQPMAARFDAALFSSELGVLKPEPAIYRAACAELGVAPQECIFVGDGSDNELHGAAAVGMRAIRTLEFANSDPEWKGETVFVLRELIGRLS